MRKVVSLTAATWTMAVMGLMAQTTPQNLPNTPNNGTQPTEDDGSDFTFTESQLDDDVDAAQTISNVASSNNDPYHSQVGYAWSAMRFKVRAYDNMYSTTFLNGLEFNDLELGRYNYSLLGGLNDLTRQKEGASGFENNSFGITGVGGGDNINLRASHVSKGQKYTLTACNRNYRARAIYTFGTGVMSNGWAFAGSFGYRWSNEGNIEGTFYNSFSYYLGAEKRWDNHTLSLATFGAPTERGQQAASTEEAYWLANSHYYNPNWGYQNGEKRNSRVVKDYEPVAILTWDWKIADQSTLSTTLAYKYSNYSTSALGWSGEAYDPRPDYYKNLPSSIFNVYDGSSWDERTAQEQEFLMNAYNSLYNQWQTKENRQINWDRMYYVNQQNGESLYYQERRHNDQQVWALSSTWNKTIDRHNKLVAGIMLNHTTGYHYKTMEDLLGGSSFLDIDKFAAGEYGITSMQAQSDMRHPNRVIGQGDKFGYNYNTYVNVAKASAQYSFAYSSLNFDAAAHVTGTTMQREGLMQNGQGQLLQQDGTYFDNSLGKSGTAKFLGGGAKAQLGWAPISGNRLAIGASYEKKAPLVRNAFVAPRVQNNYVDNLKLEDILGAEASYLFQWGPVSGKVLGYYTSFKNQVEQTAFYNDANSAFTYLTMSHVDKEHYGVELAVTYKILDNLSVHAMGTYGEALYTNNPYAQLSTEGMSSEDNVKVNKWTNPVTNENMQLLVAADGMHVGSTPLTAANVGIKYNKNYWFFEVNANYYDRVYCGFSQYRRLTNIMDTYQPLSSDDNAYSVSAEELNANGGTLLRADGSIRKIYASEQEKFESGWMFDASIGKSIRFRNRSVMSINLQLQNIGNNTNLKTGGYEQNRDDNYYDREGSKSTAKSYVFSRNSKYYYANPFNFYLNVSYRF